MKLPKYDENAIMMHWSNTGAALKLAEEKKDNVIVMPKKKNAKN